MTTTATELTSITVDPLTPTIGAEISGVDLAVPLSERHQIEIHSALLDWKVLFFRDQVITTAQQVAFAQRFGELEYFPFTDLVNVHPDNPELVMVHHGRDLPGMENTWHHDVTWRLEPSLGSVLRMTDAPATGGDTLFADMAEAYDGLPPDIKEEIDGKVARHDFELFRTILILKGASDAEIASYEARYPNPQHPVVRTHPETGRRSLFVNSTWTREIVGIDPARSERLLDLLYQQAKHPEYQCRFRWEPNCVAFWDNRACQHYAVSDYFPNQRLGERASIAGDAPYFDPDQPVTRSRGESPVRGAIFGEIAKQVAAYRTAVG